MPASVAPTSASLPVTCSPMTLADVPEVARLEGMIFTDPWSERYYGQEVASNPLSHYWVLRPGPTWPQEQGDPPAILAYGGYWILGEACHIVTLASHPEWRQRGLAQGLLATMLAQVMDAQVTEITLEVRASNTSAIALYAKFGFAQVGRRRRYYSDGEDALLLTRPHPWPIPDPVLGPIPSHNRQESS